MKKEYFQPSMSVVELKFKNHILMGSVQDIDSNVDLELGGGSSTDAMTRENIGVWDDEW